MNHIEIIVVGASMGGLKTLGNLLSGLPDDFPLPVVIVQHRLSDSDGRLAALLDQRTGLSVREVEDKEKIVGGTVFLAPSDYHLMIEPGGFALSTEAPVGYARPSIDVLFESAAVSYRDRVLGIVLTGASADGAKGAAEIRRVGGLVLVQAPETAESRVMPDAALREVPDAMVLPPEAIPAYLTTLAAAQEAKG